MFAAGHTYECLRLIGEFEKPPARAYRNDEVFLAVNHKNRNMRLTDRKIRTELIKHQPTDREKRVMGRGDVQSRQVGSLQNEGGRLMRRIDPHQQAEDMTAPTIIAPPQNNP